MVIVHNFAMVTTVMSSVDILEPLQLNPVSGIDIVMDVIFRLVLMQCRFIPRGRGEPG